MALQFKTTINCGACIKAVTPTLDKAEGIRSWSVDTEHPDKVLTVDTDLKPDAVVALVEDAGFDAAPLASA
jgi:copper chaperone